MKQIVLLVYEPKGSNEVWGRIYTESLLENLRKYHNRAIENAQVIGDDRDGQGLQGEP